MAGVKKSPIQPAGLAETLRQANLANIIKRLKAGKTLSRDDRKILDEHAAQSDGTTGRRLRKNALAAELGISRTTLDEYLQRKNPRPPQPDSARMYSVEDVAAYIAKHGVKAVSTEEFRRLREVLLRIQVEKEEIELAALRGRFIDKDKIEPVIAGFCSALTADMQRVFEGELPPKYEGKKTIECRELNASGIDRIITRLKHAYSPLVTH